MKPLLLALAFFALVAPSASAQEDTLLATFHMEKITFRFDPEGSILPQADRDKGRGSAIEVFADEVEIKELEAEDMRYCMDSDPRCSYDETLASWNVGNKNGVVEAAEVTKFEGLAAAFALTFDRVRNMTEMIENDITVDGKKGENGEVQVIKLTGVENTQVGSNKTIFADVTMRVAYQTDRNAARHTVVVRGLEVDKDGFTYQNIEWALIGDKWDYKAEGKITKNGYEATQTQFQSDASKGLTLNAEKIGAAKKKSPGADIAALAVAALVALVAVGRRKA